MKRSQVVGLIVVIAVVAVGAVIYGMFRTAREVAHIVQPAAARAVGVVEKAKCRSHLSHLALAADQWAYEHGGKLPDSDRWVDDLLPYVVGQEDFRCPADPSGARCSYGMNQAVSGKMLGEIANREAVVLFYETAHPGDNPSDGPRDVAVLRHNGGSVYAFADAHTDWLLTKPAFESQ